MFSIQISGVPVFFSKFFAASDRQSVVDVVTKAGIKAVFIDTPATSELVTTIRELMNSAVAVVLRDHHDVGSGPYNDREMAIRQAVDEVRELLGDDAVVSNRSVDPACSSLVGEGEFAESGTVIVADPDADGLTAAMKACGVVYPELDSDAAVLDGPRAAQTAKTLSPTAMLLVKGMATLPPFNPNNPAASEEAKGKLFADFVAMVSGDAEAKASFEAKVEAFESAVAEAERLAAEATPVKISWCAPCNIVYFDGEMECPQCYKVDTKDISPEGVWLVDVVGKPRFNLQTLTERLEARPGCRITVIRKDNGPIAAKHGGVQYSLAVPRKFQQEVNLQAYLPEGFTSSPEAGIISNTSFLLHVSEEVWKKVILPKLAG
ncbi:MAG: hypothetical protein Q8Q23_05380 [bacterium]|nr:hypothetical protein [bacterium]